MVIREQMQAQALRHSRSEEDELVAQGLYERRIAAAVAAHQIIH